MSIWQHKSNTHTDSMAAVWLFSVSAHWRWQGGGGRGSPDGQSTDRTGRGVARGGVSLPRRCQLTHTSLFTSSSYLAVLFQTAGSQSVLNRKLSSQRWQRESLEGGMEGESSKKTEKGRKVPQPPPGYPPPPPS